MFQISKLFQLLVLLHLFFHAPSETTKGNRGEMGGRLKRTVHTLLFMFPIDTKLTGFSKLMIGGR